MPGSSQQKDRPKAVNGVARICSDNLAHAGRWRFALDRLGLSLVPLQLSLAPMLFLPIGIDRSLPRFIARNIPTRA
jgi:hypothetical protein